MPRDSIPAMDKIIERRIENLEMNEEIHGILGCRVRRSLADQNILSGAWTALQFDTEDADVGNCWSAAAPTRLYAPMDGYYLAGGHWTRMPAENPNACRQSIRVYQGGATQQGWNDLHTIAGSIAAVAVASGMIYLAAGDYVEIEVYHNDGAARDASGTAQRIAGWLMRVM